MGDINPDLDILPAPMEMPDLAAAPAAAELLDPVAALLAVALAAGVAAAVALAGSAWQRLRPGPTAQRIARVGCLLGVSGGFVLGCWMLDVLPTWPPIHNRGRLLLLIWPAILLVEAVRPRWLVWIPRAVVAAAVGPVLLYGTSYLSGDTSWPAWQAILILGCLAVGLLIEWFLMTRLVERTSSASIPISVAMTCGGAGVAAMLHGYFTGGLLGLPLAGSLAGAAIAMAFARGRFDCWIGPGVVGLFAVVVMGYFFGTLPAARGLVLFASPLLGWVGELPLVREMRPWKRETIRLVVVMIAVGGAVYEPFAPIQRMPVELG